VRTLVIGMVTGVLVVAAAVVPAEAASALDNPGLVAVSLVPSTGRTVPLPGAVVEVSGNGQPDQSATTAADGTAIIAEPPGTYTVQVTPAYTGSADSYAPTTVTAYRSPTRRIPVSRW
jgi:hypothetical protein